MRRIEQKVHARRIQAKPVLEVNKASRNGEFEDVSFVLQAGEILGLVGLLGAGRTELALTLFGMTRLDRGQILLDGEELVLRSNQEAVAAGIAYVSEDRLDLGLDCRRRHSRIPSLH